VARRRADRGDPPDDPPATGAVALMCGIAGAYEYTGRRAIELLRVQAMLDAITHRGPDDEGIHHDDGVAIGNRRLSIIDLAGGHQPIANEHGDVVVAFNGEIYNYGELRASLIARGHTLRTDGDTEVIVHLYEDLGDECLKELRGMFALAIWDARRRRLLVARDRLGIKPLYYANEDGRLVFGSEIKALLPYRDRATAPRLDALAAFLSLKYVPSPATMFDGVMALPPGCALSCNARGVSVYRWWDVSFEQLGEQLDDREAGERLRALLEDAVSSHLVSDVPYGAFLSGGVDSSTIVALMSKILDHPVKTFAVGFEGPGDSVSELPYARMVAERYETEHHECIVGASDFVRLAEHVVWHLDQPIADQACLANYMVAELASRHVKMVLTGEGGDELFAGYARYAGERLSPITRRLPGSALAVARGLGRRPAALTRPGIAMYALGLRDEYERFATWFPLMHPEARRELVTGELAGSLDHELANPARVFGEQLDRTDATGSINRMLYVDTKLWLPDDLLARGDKTAMASSLEARVPLLDHALVEFAAGLPARFKVRGMRRKYLLKEVARDLLPTEIIDRSKKGFPVPMAEWLRGEARGFCHDLLSADVVRGRGLFSPTVTDRMLAEHDTGAADHSAQLWALISVELWHRLYVDDDLRSRLSSARSSADTAPSRIALTT
jgi:asparagine synthase (glutamine-hydrolysing)